MAETEYTWPNWMPRPNADDFNTQPVESRTLTDMEVGTVIRSEFDTDEQEASCSLLLTPEQATWFDAFEKTLLNNGTKWFWFPCWFSGEVQLRKVRFKSRPKMSKVIGLNSQYTFALQVADRELLEPNVVESLLKYSPVELIQLEQVVSGFIEEISGATLLPTDLLWS